MNTFDILILVGILVFVVLGLRDGFLKKIFGILGFLAGLICATKFMSIGAEYLTRWFSFSGDISLILSFFMIFLLVTLLINLFYRWFGESNSETLQYWSRLAGGLLGAAQGAAVVSTILVMLNQVDIPEQETKSASLFYPTVVKIAPKVFDYMMKWIPDSKNFDDEVKEIKTQLDKYKTP